MTVHLLDVCLAGFALYLIIRLVRRPRMLLPPGPRGWPIIGNLLDFPSDAPYKGLAAMSAEYGPIMSMTVMGGHYIILNSSEAAKVLLDKNSAASSDRPPFTMATELVGWGDVTGFIQNGNTHRKHRKYFHQEIGTKSSLQAFYSAEEAEAKRFVRDMLKSPDDLFVHARRMAGSVILKISHGYTVKDGDDPMVMLANKAMRNMSVVTTPGRFLVDTLPILKHLPEWFPGCGFLKDAKQWRKLVWETVNTPHQFVVEQLAKGHAAPSLTSKLLQECASPEDEDILKWTALSMYLGGSDTSPSSISAFFLAMAMYPEVLKKAQAEVDDVVGNERLPTMQDREILPYVNAVCRELMRWHVVAPMAFHFTTQDQFYGGYLIPKGTTLLGNIWFILSDPNRYPNPDVFDPERFLGENPQPDPREVCFGWGRRRCPGAQLVEMTIFICVATALATMDVSRYVENGVERVPKYDAEEGSVRHLKPFKCVITPRSKKVEGLLYA